MLLKQTTQIVCCTALGMSLLLTGCDSSGVSVIDDESTADGTVDDDTSTTTPVDDGTSTTTPVDDGTSITTPVDDGATTDASTEDGTTPVVSVGDDTTIDTPVDDGTTPVSTVQSESPLTNGNFENGLTGWVQEEPAFESGITFEGLGAVKLEESGSVTQTIVIRPNFGYVLSGWVQGPASIGVIVGGETLMATGPVATAVDIDEEEYSFVSLEFDSFDAVTADIFAVGGAGTTRADDLRVFIQGTEPTAVEPDSGTTLGDDLVDNGTFENGLLAWEQVEPAFESGDSFEGLGAVKLEESGSVTQTLVVQPNTQYLVSAYIEGTASIGVTVGGETFTATGTSEDYAFVSFEFDSLEAVNVDVFALAAVETSRVDNIAVNSTSAVIGTDAGTGTD